MIPLIPVAHGLLIGRQDLPIPQWLFAWGASLVLIVSFVALSLLWREVRFEADRWRPVSERLSRALVNPVTSGLAGALGVVLLGVVIWSGLSGTDAPDLNFSLTFVFITAWLGLVVLSVLFGNVFRALNPWRAIARAGSAGFRLVAGQPGRAPLRYPERLGRWPAVAVIVGFVWLELIYGIGGFSSVGLEPRKATIAVIVYSVYTLMAMALFGIETWLDRGEGFSVFYGMFSRLAAPEVRDGRLGLRRLLSGTTHWATVSGSIGMVIIAIGTTTFDGSQEGVFKSPIDSLFRHLNDAGLGAVTAHRLAESVFLALSLAGVAAIFWLGDLAEHPCRRRWGARQGQPQRHPRRCCRHHQPARDDGRVGPVDGQAGPQRHRLAGHPHAGHLRRLARDGGVERFKDVTGLPLATYFAGPKARWILDHVEGARERAEAGELLFGTIDSWLLWNLTGGRATAASTSSTSRMPRAPS